MLRPVGRLTETVERIRATGDLSAPIETPGQDEISRLGQAFAAMTAALDESAGAQRRLVADASHELRTPLATIRGYGELYRMGALTSREQVDDTVRRIEESATRMGRLVEDLLALARLDEGRPLRTDPVDLTVVAADALSDLRALDATRPVRIVALPDGAELGSCVVLGDEDRLRQVIANVVGNALVHTPAGTPIELRVDRVDGTARIAVTDHGPGMPPEVAAKVTQRFYRADPARARSRGGSGLGMSIADAAVIAHGGTIGVDSAVGVGTTVTVTLPVA